MKEVITMGYYSDLGGKIDEHDESGVREELLDACAVIATYSMTTYTPKSYGGYNIFRDEKVTIDLDTYVPNISVAIHLDSKLVPVLHYNFNGFAQVYKPGKWEEYVMKVLYPVAARAKEVEDNKRSAEETAEHERKFGSVEDGDLFS